MSLKTYDFVIVGAGAAGLHLAMAMLDHPSFMQNQVLIIDRDIKNKNDRTWCYWEKGDGKWDQIINHRWDSGLFYTKKDKLDLDLNPYSYKQLRGLDFYNYALKRINDASNIDFLVEEINDVQETKIGVNIITDKSCYSASHCFDSRIHQDFYQNRDGFTRIQQHFKGLVIKFEHDAFDPSVFTMMDFRYAHKDTTSFMYVLPTSTRSALVEFTFFTENLVDEEVYDNAIRKYIKEHISNQDYVIEETEKGIIPMSDYPFYKVNSKFTTKIGTAGSWVRSSTGYSFKNAERNAEIIVNNILGGKEITSGVLNRKAQWHDAILLNILKNNNHLGPEIFRQMYDKNHASKVLKFLDGETSLLEDVKIMASLNPLPFVKALFSYYLGR